jgi:hypothetical protein
MAATPGQNFDHVGKIFKNYSFWNLLNHLKENLA